MTKRRKISLILAIILTFFLVTPLSVNAYPNRVEGQTILPQINEYIAKIKADGTYDEIYAKWIDDHSSDKTIDYSDLTGENGHVIMGTATQEPFSYVNNNIRVGFTIDIMYRFCKEYGYSLEFADYSTSSGIITALQNGRCDVGGGNTSWTQERSEMIDFSDPFFENYAVIVTKKDDLSKYKTVLDFEGKTIGTLTGSSIPLRIQSKSDKIKVAEYNSVADACKALDNGLIDGVCYDEPVLAIALDNYPDQVIAMNLDEADYFCFMFAKKEDTSKGIIESLKDSVNRNFIEGQRYKLILEGLLTTFIITVASIVLGTILGFVVFMHTKKENIIVRMLSWIVDGLPGVVLLMIFYYVIFGKVNLGGVIVSIITFTLIFASSTLSLLQTSVGAIDKGQFEVSYALGYKKKEAFYKMILPQALAIAWPGYKGAIISQIKATAIVGYIAEQDLTKAGDMIRSSTFEAFFPLIIVAILYFILAWILTGIVNLISKRVGPSIKKSEKFLKGVKR